MLPESVILLRRTAQTIDSKAVRKTSTEPMGATHMFQFHRKTNILPSVLTLKSRIEVLITCSLTIFLLCLGKSKIKQALCD